MKDRPLVITVYKITGRQLFFRVPESFCEECDLSVRAVRQALRELGDPGGVEVRVRSYLNHLPAALLRGIWHPPGVVVGKRLFSQGVVPDLPKLRGAIRKALGSPQP